MKLRVLKKGVSGVATPTPDSCDDCSLPEAKETSHQSCPTATTTSKTPTQLRIYLPKRHAQRWLDIPTRERKRLTSLVFGSYTEGIELEKLLAVESELKSTRLALINALQLVLENETTLDVSQIEGTLNRIASLLGRDAK